MGTARATGVLRRRDPAGKVLYEMDGVDEPMRREAFALAAAKLPLRTISFSGRWVARMKASELRAKDEGALSKELEELLRAQFSLRMQKATQQLTNSSQLRRCAGTSPARAPSSGKKAKAK